jgi:hypothetical protein
MNDIRDDLHELLQRKADQVPLHRDVPRSLVGRARRRIAVNALGTGLMMVLLAGGAIAGLRSLGAAPVQQPAGSPPASSAPRTSTSTIPMCTSASLRAVGRLVGAAGSREGAISLTNFSDTTCTLEGRPSTTLMNGNLKPITSGVTFTSSPPGWRANGSPKPAGWPVVTLRRGASADVRIRWTNWCPDGRSAPLWRLGIPGGGTVDVTNGLDTVSPPPCNGPGLPSTIEEGPFEPALGP